MLDRIDGAKIRRLRESLGMTMKELAERVGVSEMQISYYERGVKTPSVPVFMRIADVLGVKMDDLKLDSDTNGEKSS